MDHYGQQEKPSSAFALYKGVFGECIAQQVADVELYVHQTQIWNSQGQKKVSHVDRSDSPGLFCPPAGVFGHTTSISSHKDRSRSL